MSGLLGPDLLKLGGEEGKHTPRNVLVLAQQALGLLEHLHAAGFLHRDLKPENLVLGYPGTGGEHKLHLIDFGTSLSLTDCKGARRTAPQAAEGSLPYMAVTVQQKKPMGKRDDIEGLIWTLLRLCLGKMPWEHGKVSAAGVLAHKLRVRSHGASGEPACRGMASYMVELFDGLLLHVSALDAPESEPDFDALRKVVQAAWKASGFAPASVAKAVLEY